MLPIASGAEPLPKPLPDPPAMDVSEMKLNSAFLRSALTASAILAGSFAAQASDRSFFDRIDGQWSGPGEIVAGKYKGTRFSCSFDGRSLGRKVGMALDGKCRVGLFSQEVSATVRKKGRSYSGAFLDGAKGKGLDVTSGNVQGDRVVVSMERAELEGAMVASLKGNGNLGVTVSVRVGGELVPVIGIDLKPSLDNRATASTR